MLKEGILRGDIRSLAKAITLVESQKASDQKMAANLLRMLRSEAAQSPQKNTIRIGITGTPGVGKSTFIEHFGLYLINEQHKKVAVLAVDPSSPIKGGSLLADKTRMPELSRNPHAFIRPSPSSCHLGGVTRYTNNAILLCEAAGFDVVLIETVGVGQSEIEVFSMVDFFMALILPSGGDDVQGLKRGLMEVIDLLVINKADGDFIQKAEMTQKLYRQALQWLRGTNQLVPRVLTCSALYGRGFDEVWSLISVALENKAAIEAKRKGQGQVELWANVRNAFEAVIKTDKLLIEKMAVLEEGVRLNTCSMPEAVEDVLQAFSKAYINRGV